MPPRKRSEPPTKRRRLRAVPDPPEAPPRRRRPPPKPLTLEQAVATGKYLEILKAQQRELVKDIAASNNSAAKAAMHRQLGILSKEITALEKEAAEEAKERAEARDTEDAPFDASSI